MMTSPARTNIVTAALAVLALAATAMACGDDGDGSSAATTTGSGSRAEASGSTTSSSSDASGSTGDVRLGAGDEYSVEGALAELPAGLPEAQDAGGGDRGSLWISTGDLVAASEAVGIERPEAGAPEVGRWLGALTGGPVETEGANQVVFVPFPSLFGPPRTPIADIEDELGWSVLDVDSFVEHEFPPLRFTVVHGGFDDETLNEDLVAVGAGIVSAGEGEDYHQDLGNTTAVRQLGAPLRLAQDGDRILASKSTSLAEAWVERGDTLAGDRDLAAVAGALDEAGALSAVISRPSNGFGMGQMVDAGGSPERRQQMSERVLPAPFHTVGIGWAVDGGESVITAVFQHDDAAGAKTNAEALEAVLTEGRSAVDGRPLSDLYSFQNVSVDDTMAVVTLRPSDGRFPSGIHSALLAHDLPFAHAG